ncbi:TetR family transcriptional regulator [Pseudomonas sp. LMG 31766]|jgi:TetR/AcrR family transcriptional repressor of mexCD-oprJ operon|uniref:TetR family transcriptional regulator n=1 Tax=Pseudomonas chaetocerotis TaxID=2758695 RepID=A0A931D1P5_9PSED|nr:MULTISPECIES: TetR family transcriptional regulator [Pseudomonas]MBZ9664897.1 TetR family transcriptional regulator [Pseudomonas chaetocerotis]WFS17233.1 TetR family transcriptional regulator [Pseudomonas sp. 905_Psudmo1]
MSNDEKLLKALAVAIVDRPRATLKDLAEAAGVSKATLHRFCSTRDNLVERLMNHSQTALNQVIEDADLQVADVAQALRNLIENHLRHRELLVFMIFQYRPDSLDPDKDGARWIAYTDALDRFFLRGQQEGYLRIDITAELLTELFVSLIYGMVDAERRGRAASARSLVVLEQFFLKGAGQPRP